MKNELTPIYATAERLTSFMLKRTPLYKGLATQYWALASRYGIRADYALFHALHMTDNMRNSRARDNDFGFVGAKFPTMAEGVRAHLEFLATVPTWIDLPALQYQAIQDNAARFAIYVGPDANPKPVEPEPAKPAPAPVEPPIVMPAPVTPLGPVVIPVEPPKPAPEPDKPARNWRLPWYVRPFAGKAIAFAVGLACGAIPALAPHRAQVEDAVKGLLAALGVI